MRKQGIRDKGQRTKERTPTRAHVYGVALAQIDNPILKGDLGSGVPANVFGRYIGTWWGLAYVVGALLFILYLTWGAVEWILGGSNEERVTNSKNKITNALVGLGVLAISWALVQAIGFVLGIDLLENLSITLDRLAP